MRAPAIPLIALVAFGSHALASDLPSASDPNVRPASENNKGTNFAGFFFAAVVVVGGGAELVNLVTSPKDEYRPLIQKLFEAGRPPERKMDNPVREVVRHAGTTQVATRRNAILRHQSHHTQSARSTQQRTRPPNTARKRGRTRM